MRDIVVLALLLSGCAVIPGHVNEISTGSDKGHSLEYYKEAFRDGRPNQKH